MGLDTEQFHLEPLGPQHNHAGHAAWMSSIEHIRSTPGYPDGNWPPRSGMTLEENLSDLRRHANDFTRCGGYTSTVLDPADNDVIGCVYRYPSTSEEWDVTVQSWVRADRSSRDVRLADDPRVRPRDRPGLWSRLAELAQEEAVRGGDRSLTRGQPDHVGELPPLGAPGRRPP